MATKSSNKSSKKKSSNVTRSAITGHFVKTSTVTRHPKETTTETVSRPKRKRKPASK